MLVAAILAMASAKVAVAVDSGGDMVLASASNSKHIIVDLDAKEEDDEVAAGTDSMEQMDNEDAGDMESIDKMDSTQLKEQVPLLLTEAAPTKLAVVREHANAAGSAAEAAVLAAGGETGQDLS